MKTVKISKEKLLAKLKENRASHRDQFEKALDGWKERVLFELARAFDNAKKGIRFETAFNLPRPDDHTDEYDAVIDRVEWNEEKVIELELQTFDQFIRDDWMWKRDFMATTALYSSS